jgi:hypothetical protein
MFDHPASMTNDHEDIENLKEDRRNRKEIHRPDALAVIGEKCFP